MDLRNVFKDVEVFVLVFPIFFELKQSHMFLFSMETIIHVLYCRDLKNGDLALPFALHNIKT